jgi:hypothetical protein
MSRWKGLLLGILLFAGGAQFEYHAQRVRTARIQPLEPAAWTDQHRAALGPYATAAQSNNATIRSRRACAIRTCAGAG